MSSGLSSHPYGRQQSRKVDLPFRGMRTQSSRALQARPPDPPIQRSTKLSSGSQRPHPPDLDPNLDPEPEPDPRRAQDIQCSTERLSSAQCARFLVSSLRQGRKTGVEMVGRKFRRTLCGLSTGFHSKSTLYRRRRIITFFTRAFRALEKTILVCVVSERGLHALESLGEPTWEEFNSYYRRLLVKYPELKDFGATVCHNCRHDIVAVFELAARIQDTQSKSFKEWFRSGRKLEVSDSPLLEISPSPETPRELSLSDSPTSLDLERSSSPEESAVSDWATWQPQTPPTSETSAVSVRKRSQTTPTSKTRRSAYQADGQIASAHQGNGWTAVNTNTLLGKPEANALPRKSSEQLKAPRRLDVLPPSHPASASAATSGSYPRRGEAQEPQGPSLTEPQGGQQHQDNCSGFPGVPHVPANAQLAAASQAGAQQVAASQVGAEHTTAQPSADRIGHGFNFANVASSQSAAVGLHNLPAQGYDMTPPGAFEQQLVAQQNYAQGNPNPIFSESGMMGTGDATGSTFLMNMQLQPKQMYYPCGKMMLILSQMATHTIVESDDNGFSISKVHVLNNGQVMATMEVSPLMSTFIIKQT